MDKTTSDQNETATAPGPPPLQKVERAVGGLTATVDQLAAEQQAFDGLLFAYAFAFGVLAAIVALQHRQLKGLADALAS